MFYKNLLYALVSFLPVVFIAQAAEVAPPNDFKGLVALIINIVSTLTTVVFVLTFLAIIWGVIKGWIINGAEAEGVESGRRVFFIGVVVLVITVSLWGILGLLQTSLFGNV